MRLATEKIYRLKPLSKDKHDCSSSVLFGTIAQNDLPAHDFMTAPILEIKNQDINYPSDFCPAYAAAEASEDIDQVAFVPEWSFAKAKGIEAEMNGLSAYTEFGLDLRQICDVAVHNGFLPRSHDPFHCDSEQRPPRSFIVIPNNWGDLDDIALPYTKPSYVAVTGPHDTFDNFRAALWMNLNNKLSIITGCIWRPSWSDITDGIIPANYESNGTPHAFKICGQKTINGIIYLVAQLSDATSFGDQGFFYFSREVVNKEFGDFGAFQYSAVPLGIATWHSTHNISVYDSIALSIIKFIHKYIPFI